MTTFAKKRILIIMTGGTITENVAKNDVTGNINNVEIDNFLSIVNESVTILKRNWSIEIESKIVELVNVDSSDILPENWQAFIEGN